VPLNVLIVDDEPLAREGLRMLLAADADTGRVDEARNATEAIATIRERPPQLVFLDVQMPKLDGFGVVDSIGAAAMPPVVFVTAHDRYAVRAFDLNAIDYLLKPVTGDRFRAAYARAKSRLAPDGGRQLLSMLETLANPRQPLRRLAVRHGDRTVLVPVEEIDWIGAAENYVEIHTGGANYLLHVPLQTLTAALDSAVFVRIHRSIVVNVNCIRELRLATHGQYVVELRSGVRLQSGRTYNEQLKALASNPF